MTASILEQFETAKSFACGSRKKKEENLPDNLVGSPGGEGSVGSPVVLVKGILDGDNGVVLGERGVQLRQLCRRQLKHKNTAVTTII